MTLGAQLQRGQMRVAAQPQRIQERRFDSFSLRWADGQVRHIGSAHQRGGDVVVQLAMTQRPLLRVSTIVPVSGTTFIVPRDLNDSTRS
jgi:hypothetical protein